MHIWKWIAVMSMLTLSLSTPAQLPATNASPTATGFLYKTITLDDEQYAYCVYVPPDYTPEKAWPVILFLHGSGERGSDGFLQTDVGIGRALRRHHRLIPAIVVMPQCRPDHTWIGPMSRLALRCVEEAARQYHLDPQRVYLTGISLGGQGVWHLAASLPARFAAVVPICGFAELGEPTGLAAKLAERLTALPIWCFHGDQDAAVPLAKSRELVAAIRKAGGKAEYTEIKGGTHNVWDRAYDDPELWKWLFAQQHPAATTAPERAE